MTLPYVWICLFIWTAASTLSYTRATPTDLYPKINGTETLICECPDHTCQVVYWYRYLNKNNNLQFIMYWNAAGREVHGEEINSSRFRGSGPVGQKPVYTLRITGLQADEAGLYSCVFREKNIMPDGYYIRPGVSPPTLHPPTVKTEKPVKGCKCRTIFNTPRGCEHSVLWPGIGAVLLLAILLAGTLYYFSRLPKKCRHQFAKTNQLR